MASPQPGYPQAGQPNDNQQEDPQYGHPQDAQDGASPAQGTMTAPPAAGKKKRHYAGQAYEFGGGQMLP